MWITFRRFFDGDFAISEENKASGNGPIFACFEERGHIHCDSYSKFVFLRPIVVITTDETIKPLIFLSVQVQDYE